VVAEAACRTYSRPTTHGWPRSGDAATSEPQLKASLSQPLDGAANVPAKRCCSCLPMARQADRSRPPPRERCRHGGWLDHAQGPKCQQTSGAGARASGRHAARARGRQSQRCERNTRTVRDAVRRTASTFSQVAAPPAHSALNLFAGPAGTRRRVPERARRGAAAHKRRPAATGAC
jgi:hypothetical protein